MGDELEFDTAGGYFKCQLDGTSIFIRHWEEDGFHCNGGYHEWVWYADDMYDSVYDGIVEGYEKALRKYKLEVYLGR